MKQKTMKTSGNIKSAEMAQYVFADPLRIWRADRCESNTSGEARWQTIGKVRKTFFVVYTEKEEGTENITRIISAREAEKHERELTMGSIVSTIRVGQKIPKEILRQAKKEIKAARKLPPVYDPDCPPSSPEALAEFAAMARELRRNRRNPSPVVVLRVKPDVLLKYKSLGRGYTGIMADVLNYVADNPEILTRASGAAVTK